MVTRLGEQLEVNANPNGSICFQKAIMLRSTPISWFCDLAGDSRVFHALCLSFGPLGAVVAQCSVPCTGSTAWHPLMAEWYCLIQALKTSEERMEFLPNVFGISGSCLLGDRGETESSTYENPSSSSVETRSGTSEVLVDKKFFQQTLEIAA